METKSGFSFEMFGGSKTLTQLQRNDVK